MVRNVPEDGKPADVCHNSADSIGIGSVLPVVVDGCCKRSRNAVTAMYKHISLGIES